MSEDLIARLKAAHEAATPGPWMGAQRLSMSPGMDGSQARIDSDLIVLLRNHAAEIIAALEERDRMRAVVEAARAEAQAREAMLSAVPIGAYTRNDAALMTAWIDAGSVLDAALDALEGKG